MSASSANPELNAHRPACKACPLPCLDGPARLVGVGFRCWLAGYRTSDIACWEVALDEFASALGPQASARAVGELSCWVRGIHRASRREIEIYPAGCARFCRDECMAVSMVAASQNDNRQALSTCALALLGNADVQQAIAGAAALGDALREAAFILPANAILGAPIVTAAARG